MGRFRNLSQSLKAAAFNNLSGHGSPSTTNGKQPGSTDDMITTKELPAIARETSSTSVLDTLPTRGARSGSRPTSQMYNPPTMASGKEDHIDELRPVFSFLSSHQNKLYQEGYFLKLNDLDIHGSPNADRNWTECFAQLVGTVLSLWDAAALDAAGQDGEVAPSFINLADASIKMIETLPTRNPNVQPLQNVLSVSTAGKNRYLFHFNSLHSLTQWTAGIRLAMFENASLQELYTGSLIAGKGKFLNNIKVIMDKLRFVEEDWARVRFGAGTPWRRCWYVIEPPDEKEWQKAQKSMRKRGAYERPEYPRGDIKFYDTKKTKRATPIATISNVYSAYAVYPQSKPLIDQSTLVKLEGKITIHSKPESVTEGFVFVMPEVHPAVSGFEMMLRFLFPAFDTFVLYGRPGKLIADTLDTRGLMFAMPKDRRYGYLDIIDVAGLIHTEGSDKWTEREWRKRMKDLVSRRMTMATQGTVEADKAGRRSLGARPGLRYEDGGSMNSMESPARQSTDMVFDSSRRAYNAPAAANSVPSHLQHTRSISESITTMPGSKQRKYIPSQLSTDRQTRPVADSPDISPMPSPARQQSYKNGMATEHEVMTSSNSSSSDLEQRMRAEQVNHDMLPEPTPPAPVNQPFFSHQASDRPQHRPMDRPEMRREKSRMSNATLDQLVDASRNGSDAGAAATAAWRTNGHYGQPRGVTSENPIESESYANPFPKAIIADLPSEDLTQGHTAINTRIPLSRTSTSHSISRKPLPPQSHSHPAPPTETVPVAMYDRDSSPDYASTTRSLEKQTTTKKLGGVRKTVGDPNHAHHTSSDIPDFDFGVTQSLTPGPSRPGTAAGSVSPLESRLSSGPPTPNESRGLNVDRVSPARFNSGQISPLPSPTTQSRPNSQMWHPGLATGRQSPGGLTAEEFVQHRANMARIPSGYVSRRTMSSNKVEEMTTPSPEQPSGPRKLQKKSNSRPSSRGSLLEFSTGLSAREQEHVARMTGSPLLNLPDHSRTPDPNVGLIGAISAREQDKRNMKEGISSHLVQAAIAQRQQQAQSAYMHQIQAQYRPGMNAWSQQRPQQSSYGSSGYYSQPGYQQADYYEQQYMQQHNQYSQNPYQQNPYQQGNHSFTEFYAPGPQHSRR